MGLSPLTRGNPGRCPTCWLGCRAYPRSRGGTNPGAPGSAPQRGLSPLTRGNLGHVKRPGLAGGPIPAHAGEPPSNWRCAGCKGAYPRSRGGTKAYRLMRDCAYGLSPLTRGNRIDKMQAEGWCGPIPAHAGEPFDPPGLRPGRGAYPRSRGGTRRGSGANSCHGGLSPLTRGNHGAGTGDFTFLGPIPAHAGEPMPPFVLWRLTGAYPRSRGGTSLAAAKAYAAGGLSPLTRGNRGRRRPAAGRQGPIPAHAGEPRPPYQDENTNRAYPRSRGGTLDTLALATSARGLSPLTRGNLEEFLRLELCQGLSPLTRGNLTPRSLFHWP